MAEGRQKEKRQGRKNQKVSAMLTFYLTLNDLRNLIAVYLHLVTLWVAITDQTGFVINLRFAFSQDHPAIFGRHDVITATA
ncbi:hypothetical protein AFK64_02250 [Cronobacter sakazakii]|nr:hypothetical protein ES15_0742 [Cronobacter sakazakii ES15]ALB49435.1 hypothetical protein AFK64_02250 [Cronobacter sakazakii]